MPLRVPRASMVAVVVSALVTAACVGVPRDNEYEEEVYLSLDGSATVVVSASAAALVALRGAAFPVDPRARIEPDDVREFFRGSDVEVSTVSLSRRHGRRFVHATLVVSDVRSLTQLPALDWSRYRFTPQGDVIEFAQEIGAPMRRDAAPAVSWTGAEQVAFRFHVPSEIPFHTSPNPLQRGNILEWRQPLRERIAGRPLEIRIQMESTSILLTTLLLFASTAVAAGVTFAVVVWWVRRQGRSAEA